jgi:UDP-N-acetylmuramoyl-L-alanyl-D-glutamate--2,6-diaminopimelate ligase
VQILKDMEAGLTPDNKRKFLAIADRREAIKTAVSLAGKEDIVLVAGKGHEKYQEIKGVKLPFDDREILKECFELR